MPEVIYDYTDYTDDFLRISNSMRLEDSNIVKFRVAKEFTENKRINSIDFSQDGRTLISSSDDDTIRLYDCEKGALKRELFSKKYGVDHIKYTHAHNTVIHTSTKENDTIRYLSLHDNKYLRYFVGHEKRVVTLCMSPVDDTFLSGSLDQTVKLWDLRYEKWTGQLACNSPPIASFDPEGLIFTVGTESTLRFYDIRNYEKGPFNQVKFEEKSPSFRCWKSLKFSPDGKQMLITTNTEAIYILDAFTGQLLNKLTIGSPATEPIELPSEASYSPDSQYILSGSEDGCLHIWSMKTGNKISILKPDRPRAEPVNCLKFNPKYMLIASACSRMSFWIPDEQL